MISECEIPLPRNQAHPNAGRPARTGWFSCPLPEAKAISPPRKSSNWLAFSDTA